MTMAIKLSFNMMFLVLGVLLTAQMLGLLPDGSKERLKTRLALSESVAVQCSVLANQRETNKGMTRNASSKKRIDNVKSVIDSFVSRHPEVLSAGLRMEAGLRIIIGPHLDAWSFDPSRKSADHISVPIMQGDLDWGTLEICFAPLKTGISIWGFYLSQVLLAIISMTAAAGVGSIFYFSRVFGDSNVSAVPSRVRSALDTLSDGLLVLDNDQKIVFANRAFEEATGLKELEILCTPVSDLSWKKDWNEVAQSDLDEQDARKVVLMTEIGEVDFSIGLSDVANDQGEKQGTIVSFNDVTILEKRREELLYTMRSLQNSRDMIKEQNEQLKILATRDPLTNCWNRRSFFDEFNLLWQETEKENGCLSAVMLDLDHFKTVNDNHGHAMGDDVLRTVSREILDMVRSVDIVCRYGGEEFCILLPETTLEQAKNFAEMFRKRIESLSFNHLKITASQGASSSVLGAKEPEELLEQADKALYLAKKTGRNRVVSADEMPANLDFKDATVSSQTRKTIRDESCEESTQDRIPFQVVSSLLSVLNHRDPKTAAHSMRVADLSFCLAQGLMSTTELYELEVAALLHDIGKIAVPDAILLKPGRLIEKELATLRRHSRIGSELIKAAFNSQSVVDTVRYTGCRYGGDEKFPGMLKGSEIPLSSRIVTICDAYDSMVSSSVYRKQMSREEAFSELFRCASGQFDPALVDRFVRLVRARPEVDETGSSKEDFSREFALQVAQISEEITKSFGEQDFELLQANARKLEMAAEKNSNSRLKTIASKLKEHSALDDKNEVEISKIMNNVVELLELCQTAQSGLLQIHDETLI